MTISAKITLKSKKDQPLRRFHPWVFSNAIKEMEGEPENSDLVEVYSNKQKYLGVGHYQSYGSISVRMLSFYNELFDEDFIANRIKAAWQSRVNLGLLTEENNCFRLVYAEGDRLPGLIVDFYNGVAVMQCHSDGMYQTRHELAKALMAIDEVKGVYCSISSALAKHHQLEVPDEVLAGEVPEYNTAKENGLTFEIDWVNGQKTGFFLDQRDNRELLGKYSKGKKVLNTFCYTGGFSMYALSKGADLVHSLDSSQPALDLLTNNLKLNGFENSNHKNICADAIGYMRELEEDYDIIVLDPPAFAKGRSARHNAVQAYKRLNAAAMRQIKPGGLIFTFSCSQVVDSSMFYNTIVAAGIAAERKVSVIHKMGHPADHPVSLYHQEGEYLKGLVLEIS